ncbi:MAG: nucleotidyltransferase domain-containing protein [Sphingobacteriaceae bacterium]|nr:nucleotidyltransferase domain-containing protein [Sphingobacteriaceae bacterium]
MKFGLKEEVIEKINAVFNQFPQIEKVILYGSRAKGNYRNGSDIDLTLIGEGLNLDLLNKVDIKIDDLLLAYSFDISIYKQISNPDLVAHIERIGQVFYEKIS